jgi:N-acetylglucosaminyldiphosphoundecaprenol N-acetyl-beta-D-mannosaminyltransferase
MSSVVNSVLQRRVWSLMGLPFDGATELQCVEYLAKAIDSDQRVFFTTPNLNFLISSQSDEAFKQSVLDSGYVVADGMPLIWISRLLGIPLPERVPGSGVFEILRHRGAEGGPIKVYFMGGPEGVAAKACEILNNDGSAMQGVGFHYPGFGSVEDMSGQPLIDEINASEADFVLVALGAKKGQAWIEANYHRINAPVISHLGAVVNFVAGSVARAPLWMQKSGLEWLWRIYEEHSLLKRYWLDGLALIKLFFGSVMPLWRYQKQGKKLIHNHPLADITFEQTENVWKVVCKGVLHEANVDGLLAVCVGRLNEQIEIDCSQCDYMDFAAMGTLQLIESASRREGGSLKVVEPTASVRSALFNNKLAYLL